MHIGSVLGDLLRRGVGHPDTRDEQDRRVLHPCDPGADDDVGLAFDQIRRAVASQPSVGSRSAR